MRHLLIWGAIARWVDLSESDVMAIPSKASLIAENDWLRMVKEAGGGDALLRTLGIKEISDDNGKAVSNTSDIAEREG